MPWLQFGAPVTRRNVFVSRGPWPLPESVFWRLWIQQVALAEALRKSVFAVQVRLFTSAGHKTTIPTQKADRLHDVNGRRYLCIYRRPDIAIYSRDFLGRGGPPDECNVIIMRCPPVTWRYRFCLVLIWKGRRGGGGGSFPLLSVRSEILKSPEIVWEYWNKTCSAVYGRRRAGAGGRCCLCVFLRVRVRACACAWPCECEWTTWRRPGTEPATSAVSHSQAKLYESKP